MGSKIKVEGLSTQLKITTGVVAALSTRFMSRYLPEGALTESEAHWRLLDVPAGLYRMELKVEGSSSLFGVVQIIADEQVFVGDPVWVMSTESWPDFLDDTDSHAELWQARLGAVQNTRRRGLLLTSVSFEAISEADILPQERRS